MFCIQRNKMVQWSTKSPKPRRPLKLVKVRIPFSFGKSSMLEPRTPLKLV